MRARKSRLERAEALILSDGLHWADPQGGRKSGDAQEDAYETPWSVSQQKTFTRAGAWAPASQETKLPMGDGGPSRRPAGGPDGGLKNE